VPDRSILDSKEKQVKKLSEKVSEQRRYLSGFWIFAKIAVGFE
jgi:hypothetical protein